jgi:DNA-binding response OmpR family regulator
MYCLVVEPNKPLRRAVRAVIATFEEYEVDCRADLVSAAEAMATRLPGILVVSDSFGEDGIAFLREQRRRLADARILAYSADGTRQEAIGPLVDAFLTMPFTLSDVAAALGMEC